jgi:hypothetical protein
MASNKLKTRGKVLSSSTAPKPRAVEASPPKPPVVEAVFPKPPKAKVHRKRRMNEAARREADDLASRQRMKEFYKKSLEALSRSIRDPVKPW